ncbi:MAG: hypothetical protein II275_12800, partial [Bacteroidaceae bacterium]|nr:hypothetical protein [Bacteroidaceae bacterium]
KKLVLHFLNVLCEIFQRTRSQTTLFLVCGCKGRHFPQYDKTYRQLFLKEILKKIKTHYYIIYKEGRKRRRKSTIMKNATIFHAQKADAKNTVSETQKNGMKRACHAWQIFFPRHVNEITSGRK